MHLDNVPSENLIPVQPCEVAISGNFHSLPPAWRVFDLHDDLSLIRFFEDPFLI